MEVEAFEHGQFIDVIVSGEAFELQLIGQRAAHVLKLVRDDLGLDLLEAGKISIPQGSLRERIVAEVARHLLALP